ncbi:MAG TPA: hypothetical protein VFW76_13175, partial [Ktedonobacterales bacterium]|nr:hypothetical protein [Ktedonobacterales bacterium]
GFWGGGGGPSANIPGKTSVTMTARQADQIASEEISGGSAMSEEEPRHHRHHKEHHVRRGKQLHGGSGPARNEGEGLQLPVYDFSSIPGVPRIIYPKGWTFKRAMPGGTALLLVGSILVLLGLALALLRLIAG